MSSEESPEKILLLKVSFGKMKEEKIMVQKIIFVFLLKFFLI